VVEVDNSGWTQCYMTDTENKTKFTDMDGWYLEMESIIKECGIMVKLTVRVSSTI